MRDGRFTAVGTTSELIGAGTEVVDLGGRTVLRGFVDSHAHTVHLALDAATEPSRVGLTSVAEIVDRSAAAAAEAEAGRSIQTSPIGEPPDYFDLPQGLT